MYMDTVVIILGILIGIAIISLGVVATLQVIKGTEERKELQKLLKARDLPEFVQYTQPDEDIEDEDTNLVELENMDSVINEKLDKTSKIIGE